MIEDTLWPHQRRALAELRAELRKGVKRTIARAPGGAGKTRIACAIMEGAVLRAGPNPPPNLCLFTASLGCLVEQCSRSLTANGLDAHGVLMGSHPRFRPWAPVQVGSIQTLTRRPPLNPPPKIIIPDEAHGCVSGSYMKFLTETYPDAIVIGLSATPGERLDGKGLGRVFQSQVVVATYAELIAAGVIVPPRAFIPPPPRLDEIKRNRWGEYDEDSAAEVMGTDRTIGDVIQHYRDHGEGRPFILFACNVAGSKDYAAAFTAAGIPCQHIDGTMTKMVTGLDGKPCTELDLASQRMNAGTLRGISSVAKIREGFDLPIVSCVILTRPTKSLPLYIQTSVRGDRSYTSPSGVVKRDFILIDAAGCVMEHGGLPTDDREWSLEDGKVKEASAALMKRCPPPCYAAVPIAAMVCPECGHEFVKAAAELKPIDTAPTGAKLVEFVPEMIAQAPLPWSPEDLARMGEFRDAVKRKRGRQAPLPGMAGAGASGPRSGFQTAAWEAKPWRAKG